MVASHTPPMRPGRGREAPPGRQGGSGVPGGVSGPRRSTGGTRTRSGGGLDRRPAPLNRGRALPELVSSHQGGFVLLHFRRTQSGKSPSRAPCGPALRAIMKYLRKSWPCHLSHVVMPAKKPAHKKDKGHSLERYLIGAGGRSAVSRVRAPTTRHVGDSARSWEARTGVTRLTPGCSMRCDCAVREGLWDSGVCGVAVARNKRARG